MVDMYSQGAYRQFHLSVTWEVRGDNTTELCNPSGLGKILANSGEHGVQGPHLNENRFVYGWDLGQD